MNHKYFPLQFKSSGNIFYYVFRPSSYQSQFMTNKINQSCSSYCNYECGGNRLPTKDSFKTVNHQFQSSKLCENNKSSSYLSTYSFHIQSILNKTTDRSNDTTKGKDEDSSPKGKDEDPEKELSLVKKFKLMYKQYWYVLLPVHLATSAVWYGCFYFLVKSGVDIVPIFENMGAPETILAHLRNSNAGYYGIAYALYKIATPARYTVTLGGTTISINYLKNRGYIKPVPTKEELKTMYEEKKDEFKEKTGEMREKYQEKREEIVGKYHDKTDGMREKYQEKREEIVGKYQDKTDVMKEKYKEKKVEILEKYNMNQPKSRDKKR